MVYIQSAPYVLERGFKGHCWPCLLILVKVDNWISSIWSLSIFFVKIKFQLDLHSLCEMSSHYHSQEVREAILALYHKGLPHSQMYPKLMMLKFDQLLRHCFYLFVNAFRNCIMKYKYFGKFLYETLYKYTLQKFSIINPLLITI